MSNLFVELQELLDMEALSETPAPAAAAPSPLVAELLPATPPPVSEAPLEMLVVEAVDVDEEMLAEINAVGMEQWLRCCLPLAASPPLEGAASPLLEGAASPEGAVPPAASPPLEGAASPLLEGAASPEGAVPPAASPPLEGAASPLLEGAAASPPLLGEGEEERRFGVGDMNRAGSPIQRGVEREGGFGRGRPSHALLRRQRRRVVHRLRTIAPFPPTPVRYMGCQEILSRIFNQTGLIFVITLMVIEQDLLNYNPPTPEHRRSLGVFGRIVGVIRVAAQHELITPLLMRVTRRPALDQSIEDLTIHYPFLDLELAMLIVQQERHQRLRVRRTCMESIFEFLGL
ncbi:uncharacterized protein LOC120355085 [Nilaparvata lugens]|uniref:uncharacterized protein LOC120355085 n=1 Tax=Nilaparvata lugens TaxID=108931 RepID=UPI00193D7C79|nr:uncharacterized protein LOC120355085 [Nilaparvata lugens]